MTVDSRRDCAAARGYIWTAAWKRVRQEAKGSIENNRRAFGLDKASRETTRARSLS